MSILRRLNRNEAATLFDHHPQLRTIWDDAVDFPFAWFFLRIRAGDTIIRWGRDPKRQGHCFLIEPKPGMPVGFAGYWVDKKIPGLARLRWTGVVSAHRGKGFAERTVRELRELIGREEADVAWLSESCPACFRGHIRWFRRQGFALWPDPDANGVGIPFVRTVSLRIAVR